MCGIKTDPFEPLVGVADMFRHAMCRISDVDVRRLREEYLIQNGDFLLPRDYAQHAHTWVGVAMGVRICKLCGAEHVCFRGECEVCVRLCASVCVCVRLCVSVYIASLELPLNA